MCALSAAEQLRRHSLKTGAWPVTGGIISLAQYRTDPEGEEGNGNPLCFFCFAGAPSGLPGGADSVKPCPTTGGHPKGLGLEGIRGAS
jgi:hypothetical protein